MYKGPFYSSLLYFPTHGVRSPKFIWAPCAQLYSLAETRNSPTALLVSQERRHLFVTPFPNPNGSLTFFLTHLSRLKEEITPVRPFLSNCTLIQIIVTSPSFHSSRDPRTQHPKHTYKCCTSRKKQVQEKENNTGILKKSTDSDYVERSVYTDCANKQKCHTVARV